MRTLLEVCLIIFLIWYFSSKKQVPGQNNVVLTEKVLQKKVETIIKIQIRKLKIYAKNGNLNH